MKTRKIRLLSALLALAMLLALLPTAAFAEDSTTIKYDCGENGNNVIATLDTVTGTLTISGSGKMADYNSNGSPWSVNVKKAIQTVVIGKDVTSIGNCAFYNTTDLTSVTFENGSKLTNIGQAAFGSCRKLTSITIPFSVTTIGANAFVVCEKLTSITIPSSVTSIGANAFKYCSGLQSVTFAPNSGLKTIGTEAFEDCHKDLIICYSNNEVKQALTNAGVSAGIIKPANPTVTFDSKGGSDVAAKPVKNGDAISAPDAPTKDGYIFAGWYTDVALTQKYDFSKAVKDNMTLYAKWIPGGTCGVGGNDLTWTLDDSGTLTISGSGAMADYEEPENQPWKSQRNSIRKVVIGDKVTSIGENAFANCPGLKAVELPPNGVLETIKYNAFSWVGSSSEVSAGITEITIPKSVITIEKYAFDGCTKLATVTFAPNSKLETIGRMTFQGTAISEISIPASVKTIDSWAFDECTKLATVTFAPNSKLETIGHWAFEDTAISEISIPASVKTIGNSVFNKCLNLTKVIFESPSSLENVSSNTFVGCSNATIYYSDETAKNVLSKVVSPDRIKLLTPTVTFVSNGGSNVEPATVKNGEKISAPAVPTREGWNFAGWYTKDESGKWAAKPFDFDTPIMDNMTLYARWETKLVDITPAVELYPITIDYGTAYDAEGNPIEKAAAGDVVTIEASETALDGMTFERWEVRKGNVELENDRAAKTSFTMPDGMVQLEAMYQAADSNDSGWDAATVVTGAVIGTGTAILAYHIGMEVYAEQVLGKDVAVPRTRAEVALLAWQLAGSPAVNVEGEPLSEAAQAERWAVESGLMQNDAQGNFNGAKKMSKLKALRTLEKAKQ